MSTLTTYSGLQIVTPNPIGPGGRAINNNFKALATHLDIIDPDGGNDSTQGYSAGSRWYNTATTNEWICLSAAPGAASWAIITNLVGVYLPLAGGTMAGDLNIGGYNVNANIGGGTGGGTWNFDLANLTNVNSITFDGGSAIASGSLGLVNGWITLNSNAGGGGAYIAVDGGIIKGIGSVQSYVGTNPDGSGTSYQNVALTVQALLSQTP